MRERSLVRTHRESSNYKLRGPGQIPEYGPAIKFFNLNFKFLLNKFLKLIYIYITNIKSN